MLLLLQAECLLQGPHCGAVCPGCLASLLMKITDDLQVQSIALICQIEQGAVKARKVLSIWISLKINLSELTNCSSHADKSHLKLYPLSTDM